VLKRGEIAPDFPIGPTSLYRLLEDRATAVFFFPKAFTPGCTREAAAFRHEFENLQRSGCDVVGVSRDTQDTSDRFRASLELPFPLVGDESGEVLKAYKVRWPVIGLARRVTYLVGRNHKVRLAFHSEFDVGAHVDETCAALTRPEA
jgi:thioredoxin-dependent peroxiredoxin